MELKDRIIKRIVAQYPVTYEKLEALVLGIGHTEIEFMEAMEAVHCDKRVVQSTKADSIVYRPYIAPPVKEHFVQNWKYPYPGRDGVPEFVMPWPEWDLSFIFLRPEELEKYKAEAKGRTYIKKHGYQRKQSTERGVELSPD